MQLFLNTPEKENLRNWKYAVEDNSLTTKMFTPFWNWLVKLVPNTVAPNILTLVGFLFILYSFHLAYNYGTNYNSWISIVVCLCTFIYDIGCDGWETCTTYWKFIPTWRIV